jgi:hypothetical protein
MEDERCTAVPRNDSRSRNQRIKKFPCRVSIIITGGDTRRNNKTNQPSQHGARSTMPANRIPAKKRAGFSVHSPANHRPCVIHVPPRNESPTVNIPSKRRRRRSRRKLIQPSPRQTRQSHDSGHACLPGCGKCTTNPSLTARRGTTGTARRVELERVAPLTGMQKHGSLVREISLTRIASMHLQGSWRAYKSCICKLPEILDPSRVFTLPPS